MIFVTLLWSTGGVITRHLESTSGIETTFWRSAFNGLALAIVLTLIHGAAFGRRLLRIHGPKVKRLA